MVSVIIPLDSGSRYCEAALESILAQKQAVCEILIIPAAEDETLLAFTEEISRHRTDVTLLSQCRSIAEAVNLGVATAKGEFIHICTGREILSPGAYSEITEQLVREDADIACFGWQDHTGVFQCSAAYSGTGNMQAFLELMLTDPGSAGDYSGYGTMLWNKIFRRRIFFLENTQIEATEQALDMMGPVWLTKLALNCGKAFFSCECFLKRVVASGNSVNLEHFDLPGFRAQVVETLAFVETLSVYAYRLMRQLFFSFEVKILLACREQKRVKLAQEMEQYLLDYYGVPFDDEQVVQMFIRAEHQQKTITGLRRDVNLQNTKMQKLEERTENLTADRTFLQKQRESQAKRIESLTADRTFLQKQRESQAKRIEGLTADRTFLQKQRESQAKRIEGLEADRTFLQKQRESQAKRIEGLTADRTFLQKQRESQAKKIENLTAERMCLQELSESQSRQIMDLEADKTSLKSQTRSQAKTIAFLEADLAELQYRNEELGLALAEFQGSFLARTALKLNRVYRKIRGFISWILHMGK